MSVPKEQLQRALELANERGLTEQASELQRMIDGYQPSPGALPDKPDYTDPEQYALSGQQKMDRERSLAQSAYDYDQGLADDPANRPTRQEMNDFIRDGTNLEFGAGPIDSMQRRMIRDPKTGKVRWTALSPDDMDWLDKRGETISGTIGALAYGTTRLPAAGLQNVDAQIAAEEGFQSWLLTGNNSLPKAEQDRVRSRLAEQYGEDHSYVTDPGKAPPDVVKEIMDENPDNEATLDAIAGKEWGAERKEFFKRLGTRILGLRDQYGITEARNPLGADDPGGALTGRESFPALDSQYYEEGGAPAYPGASEDLRDWRSTASSGRGLYGSVIKPLIEGKTGKSPGELATKGAEQIRDKFYSDEQEREADLPLLNPDVEVTDFSSFLKALEGDIKLTNPEAMLLMFMENAPELGFSFAVTRGAGGVAARGATRGMSSMSAQRVNQVREAAAGRAGMLAGGATEGLIVQTHVEAETMGILNEIPIETWRENPLFQKYVEGGLTEEAAKQIMAKDAASKAGTSAAVITMMTGAPMNRFMGRSAAGRLIQSRPGLRRATGFVGEPATEGMQEVMEMLQTEAAVRPIDPENPIFKNPNRYLEAGIAGAAISLPFGAMSAIEPSEPVGLDKKDVDAARASVTYMNATNERFKYEAKIADPEHIANTTPMQRLIELEKLESLQEKEADTLLKAAPVIRSYLENDNSLTAQTELKMLGALEMRANAMKTDIAVAKSKRTTASALQEEEQRILKDRADLQRRVTGDIVALEDVERLAASIEKVQNLEALTDAEADELVREGYASRRDDGQLVILPKGKRATKELMRQARALRGKLEAGYSGPERRQGENLTKRQLIDQLGPAEREKQLYTDPLTNAQNRRAFNERQENIDAKEGQTKRKIPGAAPAVAAVDVDSLKWVNDNMTHAAGDRLLMAVTDALDAQEGVEVYRLGGDEFAVTGPSQEALETALQAAATQLQDTEIATGEDAVTPTITWGKGETYEQADAESVDRKRDRQRRGVVANRKGQPATYRVRSQMGLFAGMSQDEVVDTLIERDQTYRESLESGALAPEDASFRERTPVRGKAKTQAESKREAKTARRQRILDSLNAGIPVTEIARREGVARQTVYNIQKAERSAEQTIGLFNRPLPGRDEGALALKIGGKVVAEIRPAGPDAQEREVLQAALEEIRSRLKGLSRIDRIAKKKLSEKEAKMLDAVELRLYDNSMQAIADELGVTEETIDQYFEEFINGKWLPQFAGLDGRRLRRPAKTKSLSEKQKQILRLTDEGMKTAEIAEHLGLAENTVYTMRSQARKIIRESDGQGLFMDGGANLHRSFRAVKNIIERGDAVEVLGPDGAMWGVVTDVSKNRGRGRIRVNLNGRDFFFNADKNHLIVENMTNPSDLAWISGDASYAQPDRDSLPQIMRDIQLGHLAKDGALYADLAQEYESPAIEPWWNEQYPDLEFSLSAPVPEPQPASVDDMIRAADVALELTKGMDNKPRIHFVRDVAQLKREAPQIVDQMMKEGANLDYVRGYMDHINPSNGVFVFLQNLGRSNFEQNVMEVVAHEVIGHYGVRGFFGDEAELRTFMNDLVDSFPRLADSYSAGLGLSKAIPEEKQVLGEEMVAYIAGEVAAGRTVFENKKQRTLWERFLDWVRKWMTRKGWDRYAPVKKMISLHDSKEIFWNDDRVQDLLFRSGDFLRNGEGFRWRTMGGNTRTYMRDGNIFQAGTITAMESATYKPTKRQKNELAARYGGKENVPDEVPLFPDSQKINAWKTTLQQAQKEGWMTTRELELSGLSDNSEFNFFRDSTYGSFKRLIDEMNGGKEDPEWHKGILPPALSNELDAIAEAMQKNEIVGPVKPDQYDPLTNVYVSGDRGRLNPVSHEAMLSRINDILAMSPDPKKTVIPKELLKAHLLSDNAFRVNVKQEGDTSRQARVVDLTERLFGEQLILSDLTPEQKKVYDAEAEAAAKYGYDVGYDEVQKRWFDWTRHTNRYSDLSPQGTRITPDFRVALITTEGYGGEMGYSGHYNENLMHIRTGVAEQLENYEGAPILPNLNPDQENRYLSMIELQSDWLQSLRKGFSSSEHRNAVAEQQTKDKNAIRSAVTDFGVGVAADLNLGLSNMLKPIGNLPDGSTNITLEGYTGGSLMQNMKDYVRNETGRLWEDLTFAEKDEQWKNYTTIKLDFLYNQITEVKQRLSDYIASLPTSGSSLGGTQDVRGFEVLDNMVMDSMVASIRTDLEAIQDKLINEVRYARNQRDMVNAMQELQRQAFRVTKEGFSEMPRDRVLRVPMLSYQMNAVLEPLYDFFEADPAGIASNLSRLENREQVVVRVPKTAIADLATATKQQINPPSLVEDIITQSRIARESDIGFHEYSISVANGNPDWVEVYLNGNKSALTKLEEVIPKLFKKYVEEHGQEKRDIAIRNAQPNAETEYVSDVDLDYETLARAYDMESADIEEGDDLTSQYSVQTYYEFEESELPEIESDVVNEAWDEVDWDEVEADGEYEGVSRDGAEYRSRLEIDNDGDVYNNAAEEYLNEQRENYRTDVLWQDEDIRMQAYERIREKWEQEGPSALIIGSMPVQWDSDGEPIDTVQIMIKAEYAGAKYEVIINNDTMDYAWDLDSAKGLVSDAVKEYYQDERISVPDGQPFGTPLAPTQEVLDVTTEANPNWEIVGNNIADNVQFNKDRPIDTKKAYERYVNSEKKLRDGGINKGSPLSKDEAWRPIALKYLIADAVRRGLNGIVWNNGLASATRGGMGMSSVTQTSRITWTKETMILRGEEQSVYVIRSPDLNSPLAVSPERMVPILGTDVMRQIFAQEKGKIPVPDITKGSDAPLYDLDPDNKLDAYLVSTTGQGISVVYRRENHEFVGFANGEAELESMIEADFDRYRSKVRRLNKRSGRTDFGSDLQDLEPIRESAEIVSRGLITEETLGAKIHIASGGNVLGYSDTFSPPMLAGSRQSYEDMTYRIWNKELKKYKTQIKETYVKAENMRKAYREEGATVLTDTAERDRLIEEQHGRISIEELQGPMHGYVIMSEKQGAIFEDVWTSRAYAQEQMDKYIEDEFGTPQRGVKVSFIEITDEMREEFSKPVAPFMMMEGPELESARKKVGAPKTGRLKDLRERVKRFRQAAVATTQQGMFDQFYGIKRALRAANVDDGPYISARLSTSLDSMMKGILYQGHPVWKDGIVQSEGRGLMDILKPILPNHQDWGLYMAGRRAKQLMLEGFNELEPNEQQKLLDASKTFFGDTDLDKVFAMMAHMERGVDPMRNDLAQGERAGVNLTQIDQLLREIWTDPSTGFLMSPGSRFTKAKKIGKREYNEVPAMPDPVWRLMERQAKSNGIATNAKWREEMKRIVANLDRRNQAWNQANARQAGIDFDLNTSDVNEIVAKLRSKGREHLFTPAEIDSMVKMGDQYPYFERVAEQWAEFNKNMLDFAEESGIIDGKTRPTWETAVYVPFYRVDDDRLVGSSMSPTAGIANQKAPIRRLRGGEKNIGDVVGNILVNVAKMTDAAVKNNAALETIDALRGTGIVQKKPLAWKPTPIPAGQIKKVLIDRGVIVPDDQEGIHLSDIDPKALEGFETMFAIGAPSGDGVMSVMRNGKREYYYTEDPLLFRAMTSINKKAFGEWISLFRGPKRLLTTMITIDPSFMVANFMRDTGSAFVISRDSKGNIPVVSALAGFNSALFKDEAIRTMTMAGAAFENGYVTGGDETRTKRLIKEAMKSPSFASTVLDSPAKLARAWLALGAAVENSNRVAVYNAALRAGKSKKRAAFEAKDLMDFSMGGDWPVIQFLKQTVPFMNARLQGNYRLGKSMVEHPLAFGIKGFLVGLAGFSLWAAFKDDERYKELEMWDKHAYFHWWIGDMHFRLPKPFEVGALFNTQIEMWGNYLNSEETDAGKELLRNYGHMVGETFSMNPIPQTFMPMVESGINYSFFRQGPLVSYYEQKRLPPDQYRYRTSPTLIELAKRLPKGLDTTSNRIRSPLHLQNLYSGYTGTIGNYMLKAADALVQRSLDYPAPPAYESQDWPVWGRFVRGEGPPRRTKYEAEVYKLLEKTTAIQGSLSFHEKFGNEEEYLKTHSEYEPYVKAASTLEDVRENIQEVNKQIQMIYLDPDMGREEKTKEIDSLEIIRNELFREGWKYRPGGEYNPTDAPPVTRNQIIDMIDNWGVDNSTAFMRRIEENAPDTYELLEMVQNDMASRQLQTLAKLGGNNE